jgi:hypothetical protein
MMWGEAAPESNKQVIWHESMWSSSSASFGFHILKSTDSFEAIDDCDFSTDTIEVIHGRYGYYGWS